MDCCYCGSSCGQGYQVLCLQYLVPLGTVPVINGVFHLTYVGKHRSGLGCSRAKLVFIPAVILVSIVLVYLIWSMKDASRYMRISLALILGGAIGNLIDRLWLGYVVDFLDFRVWPVFNVADSCVVVGAVLLGYLVVVKGEGIK